MHATRLTRGRPSINILRQPLIYPTAPYLRDQGRSLQRCDSAVQFRSAPPRLIEIMTIPKSQGHLRWPIAVAYVMMLAACTNAGSLGKPDWQSRIGQYTLDDAKRELGPPESCVDLDDGGSACSWTTSKGPDLIDRLILTFDLKKQLATANDIRF